ncbi:MAG: carboxypeptidase regulatory-like domain-containing protein [Alphaproteobacteria bacterium]
MRHYRSHLLGTAAVALIAFGAQAQTTIYTSPAAGDTSAVVPPGSTVVVPASTGTPRSPEVVNPPGAKAGPGEAASDPSAGAADDPSYSGHPHVQNGASGVTFVTGGVGIHGKEHIEAMAKDYRLKLMFAVTTGHYLANVSVTVTDKGGATMLSTTTDGPFLLANLPAGKYKVSSTYEGVTKTTDVTVGASGTKSYDIVFKTPVS